MLHLLEPIGYQVQMVFRLQIVQQFHCARHQPDDARRPIHIILTEMIGQGRVVDTIMLQGFQETSAVQFGFGDFVGTIQHPKLLVQRMVHLMKLMGARDTKIFQLIFLIDTLKGHLSGSVEIPQCAVQIEEDVLILF